jgi:hypothetical protein
MDNIKKIHMTRQLGRDSPVVGVRFEATYYEISFKLQPNQTQYVFLARC